VGEYADYYARIYTAAATITGSDVVVDSSKNPGLAFCLCFAGNLDVRVLHLVRDARGVAYSVTKEVPCPETDGAILLNRRAPAASALLWNADNAAFSLLARLRRRRHSPMPWAGSVQQIRYEDLLADPRGVVRNIAAFAGLNLAATDLPYLADEYADLGPGHSAAGNPMRFKTGRVPLRHDDEWRTRLPLRHRRLVGVICAPLLAAYGYPLW
jgi:hypothetical protein